MGKWVVWMDQKLYPNFDKNWDDTTFRAQIERILKRNDQVLDLGAGAGIIPQMNFRGQTARVCGIDPDESVCANPYLDEFKIAAGEAIPYPNNTFDMVFADNVLEHLEAPQVVFSEVARVLKPGGSFLAKTPNKWHYMPLIAKLTPHRFHQYFNRLRGRRNSDTFPTYYRANTPKEINLYAGQAGLHVEQIILVEGRPEYLRLAAPLYFGGWVYERLVNSFIILMHFRILIIAILKKPSNS